MLLEDVLLIFLKYPQPGLVKTRLAKDIGKERACRLYRLFVESVLARTKCPFYSNVVFYSPATKKKEIMDWLGLYKDIYPQIGSELGARLSYAFHFIFKKGAKKIIAIGTDIPLLDSRLITEAFNRLNDATCVLGPALDGGYYLLGLTSFYKEIFEGITWSKDDVLEKTKDKLCKLGIDFKLLEPHIDIDSIEDLCLLKQQLNPKIAV